MYTPTPALTAAPSLATAALELRQAATTSFSYGDNCYAMDAALTCDNGMVSCLATINYGASNYLDQYSSCYCGYGLGYLDCYFSALDKDNCLGYLGIDGKEKENIVAEQL